MSTGTTGSSDDYTGKESSCASSLRRARAAKRKQAIVRDKQILDGRLSHIEQTLAGINEKLNLVISAQSGSFATTTTMTAAVPLPPPGLSREHVSEIDEAVFAIFSEVAAEPEECMHTTIGVQTVQIDTSVLELQIAFLETKIMELGVCDEKIYGISIGTQTVSSGLGKPTEPLVTSTTQPPSTLPTSARPIMWKEEELDLEFQAALAYAPAFLDIAEGFRKDLLKYDK